MTYIPIPQPLSTTLVPPGGEVFRRFSRNASVGTTYEMVDATGATSPQYRTTAARIELRSDNAADTFLGTGARTVNVVGLNASFNQVSEVVQMNGTATVTTTTLFLRIIRIDVVTSGTYGGQTGGGGVDGANIGTITANYLGAPTVVCTMRPQSGREFSSAICVPAGFYAGVTSIEVTVDTTKVVDIILQFRDGADIVTAPYSPMIVAAEMIGVGSGAGGHFDPALPLSPTTDLYVMARTSSGTSAVGYTMLGYFVPL